MVTLASSAIPGSAADRVRSCRTSGGHRITADERHDGDERQVDEEHADVAGHAHALQAVHQRVEDEGDQAARPGR